MGALVLAGCSTPPKAEGGFVGGDGSLTLIPPEQRQLAPRLVGETLDGELFDSDSLAGDVIVYNVWGSWCAPCRKEAPALEAAAQRTQGTATFVGMECSRKSGGVVYAASSWMCLNPSSYSCGVK